MPTLPRHIKTQNVITKVAGMWYRGVDSAEVQDLGKHRKKGKLYGGNVVGISYWSVI